MGKMKGRMVLRPQHSVPLFGNGYSCYETVKTNLIWEAIFQVNVDYDDNDVRVPLVHQRVNRYSVARSSSGTTCLIEQTHWDEYFTIGNRGWTGLDYHWDGGSWGLECPSLCRWTSFTVVTGNLVMAEPVNGKKWKGEPMGGGVEGQYYRKSATKSYSQQDGNGNWSAGGLAQPATDGYTAPNHGPPIPKYGSYWYAYAAQVSHCRLKSGAIETVPSGSPADVVHTEDLAELMRVYGLPFPVRAPDLPVSGSGSERAGPMEQDGIGTNSQAVLFDPRAINDRAVVMVEMPPAVEALSSLYDELWRSSSTQQPVVTIGLSDSQLESRDSTI